ncbi:hypothetical protein [uncultured Dokdonia sp.]|uniref:hypothetical protein n=1 Tax=uncultured Dokdonia sp. TaxID=575653 RepID=UPI00262EA83D|nr:hypothetical protein [uncultured Dokdonia sp.]
MSDTILKSNVIIVAPLSSLSLRTRLYKLALLLHKIQCPKITHVGWERLLGEQEEHRIDFNIDKKILLKGGGYGSGRKYLYLLWVIKVFFYSFTIKRNEIVWALGFESAFPLLLASKIKGFTLCFDDADRFSMLIKNSYLRRCIKVLEVFTSRRVYKHVIPSFERYNFKSNTFYLVTNVPSEDVLQEARRIYDQKDWKDFALTININGWLSKSRGIAIALQVCDRLKNHDIGFIMAGKLDCEEAILLSQRDNVQYLGEVSNEEALASYYASDLVFTYYDPISEINRHAASNKWGDALKTGIGILVNKEVISAQKLIDQEVAIGLAYDDIEGLLIEIKALSANKNRLEAIKKKALNLGKDVPYFNANIRKIFTSS